MLFCIKTTDCIHQISLFLPVSLPPTTSVSSSSFFPTLSVIGSVIFPLPGVNYQQELRLSTEDVCGAAQRNCLNLFKIPVATVKVLLSHQCKDLISFFVIRNWNRYKIYTNSHTSPCADGQLRAEVAVRNHDNHCGWLCFMFLDYAYKLVMIPGHRLSFVYSGEEK